MMIYYDFRCRNTLLLRLFLRPSVHMKYTSISISVLFVNEKQRYPSLDVSMTVWKKCNVVSILYVFILYSCYLYSAFFVCVSTRVRVGLLQ